MSETRKLAATLDVDLVRAFTGPMAHGGGRKRSSANRLSISVKAAQDHSSAAGAGSREQKPGLRQCSNRAHEAMLPPPYFPSQPQRPPWPPWPLSLLTRRPPVEIAFVVLYVVVVLRRRVGPVAAEASEERRHHD